MRIRPYKPTDEPDVVRLWQRAGLTRPWNDPKLDIQRKMCVQSEWFVVGVVDGRSSEDDRVIASAMAGYDGHRGWINYLAVDPDFQRAGCGRDLMSHLESLLLEAGCPKVNLQVRADNSDAIAFYESIGFLEDKVVSYGKRLISDES